jgi:hypothetical protein
MVRIVPSPNKTELESTVHIVAEGVVVGDEGLQRGRDRAGIRLDTDVQGGAGRGVLQKVEGDSAQNVCDVVGIPRQ